MCVHRLSIINLHQKKLHKIFTRGFQSRCPVWERVVFVYVHGTSPFVLVRCMYVFIIMYVTPHFNSPIINSFFSCPLNDAHSNGSIQFFFIASQSVSHREKLTRSFSENYCPTLENASPLVRTFLSTACVLNTPIRCKMASIKQLKHIASVHLQ